MLTYLVGDVDDGVSREQRLRIMSRFAVITQVQQTLRAVEIGGFNTLTTYTRIAPMRRLGDRLRDLAHAHRVAATSVTGRRRR